MSAEPGAPLRGLLTTRRNRRVALALLLVGALFFAVHDWSGGRVDSSMAGSWTVGVTDGIALRQMDWQIKSNGTYTLTLAAGEEGKASLRNGVLTLAATKGPRRAIRLRIED